MRRALCTLISCLVLLVGLFVVENTTKANSISSIQNHKLDSLKTYKQKAQFIFLVGKKLEEEGYSSILVKMLYASKGKQEITIQISNSEYKGEKTKETISKFINDIAEENKLGKITVFLNVIS